MKYPSSIPGWIPEHQGKVRDSFAIPSYDDLMLVVATDRASTHNMVHKSPIPGKGESLTVLTVFWLTKFEALGIRTHLVAYGRDIYRYIDPIGMPEDLHLRAIVVRRMDVIDREFIFRARMGGSLWKEYYSKGLPNPYGLELPSGLQLMSPFENLIFTPTEKSENDEPLLTASVLAQYPEASALAERAFKIVRQHNLERGIDTLDGKGEIGRDKITGELALVDEFGTPDCCRYVEASEIVVGQEPDWHDKQLLREEAERIWKEECGEKHPICFSPDIVHKTSDIYRTIPSRIMDMSLQEFQATVLS